MRWPGLFGSPMLIRSDAKVQIVLRESVFCFAEVYCCAEAYVEGFLISLFFSQKMPRVWRSLGSFSM